MDRYWKENHPYPNPNQRQKENPSFSSSLLDSIYRSIDGGVEEIVNMRKKVVDEKLVFDKKRDSPVLNSCSSSSNGFSFSSTESESPIRIEKLQGVRKSSLSKNNNNNNKQTCQQPKNDLKKKVKQPISPGRRLASFLNSIFTVGSSTPKKEKKKPSSSSSSSKLAEESSTCSSVSSFSRSCLSKTPSSRTKLISSNGMKRSVRFYPAVSVIVDRDIEKPPPPPPSTSALRDAIKEEFKLRVMEKNRRVEEAARDLLKNRYYQKKVETYERFDMKNIGEFNEDDDDDDDDDASYSSSDLFELDNLSTIGMERYCEELPVYETTHFDTNRAIANGLLS